jgi:hypothetical protein
MLGYCVYAIDSGDVMGGFAHTIVARTPLSFWTTILVIFGIGAVFLFGYVSWRN